MVWIIDNLVAVVNLFVGVAGNDPLSPLLLLGAIGVLTVALGSFGVLALGGIAATLTGS